MSPAVLKSRSDETLVGGHGQVFQGNMCRCRIFSCLFIATESDISDTEVSFYGSTGIHLKCGMVSWIAALLGHS